MTSGEQVRHTLPDDASALRAFPCSAGAWYENEVQTLVRGKIADRVAAGIPALIVEDADGEIVAVAAHEARRHPGGSGSTVSYLLAVATRREERGDGSLGAARLTRVLRATFADMLASDREPLCYCMVAVDNAGMRSLCEACGFVAGPVPSDARYCFYTSRLARQE